MTTQSISFYFFRFWLARAAPASLVVRDAAPLRSEDRGDVMAAAGSAADRLGTRGVGRIVVASLAGCCIAVAGVISFLAVLSMRETKHEAA
jgi:hypothetical protein